MIKLKEPIQREERPKWSEVPVFIINKIENILKAKIIKAEIAWGGFSNTACFIVELDTGNKAFIKGTHPLQDAHGVKMVMQEIEAYKNISVLKNISPKILGHVEDGNEDGWSLIIFEYIEAEHIKVFDLDLIKNIFLQLKTFHEIQDNKNILHAKNTNYIERYFKEEGGWLRITEDKKIFNKFIKIFKDQSSASNFFQQASPLFCEYQKAFTDIKTIEGVLHQDLRVDNLLVTTSNKIFVIDWPNYCFGPVALDLAMLLPSLSYYSDYNIEQLFNKYNQVTELNIDEDSFIKALITFSGFIADAAYRQVPEKLPRLRWMQKTILQEALQYLSVKIGIGEAPEILES